MEPVLVKVTVLLAIHLKWVTCSIGGEFNPRPLFPGEDPCKPFFWFPRHVPEFCFQRELGKVDRENFPSPYPLPGASGPYMSMPPGTPYIAPAGYPGGYQTPQAGLVPGVEGIVSPDGGINLLPMTDAYSEVLERHRNKVLMKKLEKLMAEFGPNAVPGRRRYSGRRMY